MTQEELKRIAERVLGVSVSIDTGTEGEYYIQAQAWTLSFEAIDKLRESVSLTDIWREGDGLTLTAIV